MEKTELKKWIKKDKSTREISVLSGKSQTTVRYWLKKYDLKTNKIMFQCHVPIPPVCKTCGEDDPAKFYGHSKRTCRVCHNEKIKKNGKDKRDFVIEWLGGKCRVCGFNKYKTALDCHHTDPSKKDIKFSSHRGWGLERLKKELENCVLLCRNCHAGLHWENLDLLKMPT